MMISDFVLYLGSACVAGVFFGRPNVFALESAYLKLPEERRKWGFLLSPIFHYHKIKDGGYNNSFAHPKYACTAGYV